MARFQAVLKIEEIEAKHINENTTLYSFRGSERMYSRSRKSSQEKFPGIDGKSTKGSYFQSHYVKFFVSGGMRSIYESMEVGDNVDVLGHLQEDVYKDQSGEKKWRKFVEAIEVKLIYNDNKGGQRAQKKQKSDYSGPVLDPTRYPDDDDIPF